MEMFEGLDVGGKRTARCIVDEEGKIVVGHGRDASGDDRRRLEAFSGQAFQGRAGELAAIALRISLAVPKYRLPIVPSLVRGAISVI